MPHLSIDLRAEFRAGVVDPWLADHGAGETPNPCVRCNGNVRLDAMLELGERLGARTLATGHYARVVQCGETGVSEVMLRMAADIAKDQSYVLSALAPESLRRLCFPLGELRKEKVRELAVQAGLPVARKPDSQDLCFLAGTRQGDFLQRHGGLGVTPGPIVDEQGAVLGEHRGAHSYTVGQRHGLGIGSTHPLYVLATDTRANTVTVGPRAELLCGGMQVREVTLHRDGGCVDGREDTLARAAARMPVARRDGCGTPPAHQRGAGGAGGAHGAGPVRVPVRGRAHRRLRHHRLT